MKIIYRRNIFLSFAVGLSILWTTAYGSGQLKWFPFNREDALKEWNEKIFHGRVLYTVKPGSPKGYLLAKSDKASSGLYHKITFSPKKYPYISWSWKVLSFPSRASAGGITKKSWIESDDYALRVYVIFPALIFTNTKCLEYVWSQDLPKGALLTSPFFKNIKLMVLEKGQEKSGEWMVEERNIFADYKTAFGRFPSANVGAVALMTDSDNTQSSAEACYADIKVGYEKAIFGYPAAKETVKVKPKGISGFLEYIKRLREEVRDEKRKRMP